MRTILRISGAAAIALHALDLLAGKPGAVRSTAGMAKKLGVSGNHLSKIMQRLTRAGFVSPSRGPRGGFSLSKKCGGHRLRNVFESVDGPLVFSDCLMKSKVCGRRVCVFGGFIGETGRNLEKILSRKISDLNKGR